MQKEKGIVSIKVKLLGVIVPVVIVSILVLVLIAYRTSAGLIESYSENLLESSVENQASQIESWLEQNIGAFQIVKTTIENTKPDDKELQTMLDSYYNYNSNYPEVPRSNRKHFLLRPYQPKQPRRQKNADG